MDWEEPDEVYKKGMYFYLFVQVWCSARIV